MMQTLRRLAGVTTMGSHMYIHMRMNNHQQQIVFFTANTVQRHWCRILISKHLIFSFFVLNQSCRRTQQKRGTQR